MNECPSGCGRPVGAGKLMCGPCWSEVPRHLQTEVYRTWNRYRSFTGLQQSAERTGARLAYQTARDNALGAIR